MIHNMESLLYALLIPYCLGCISFSWLAVRLKARLDLRNLGTGNLGAKNTMRIIGPLPGVLVGLLDAGKGWLSLYLISLLVPGNTAMLLLAGLMVLVGHNFPFWLGFHGGKGLAALLGVMLFFSPWLLLSMLLLALLALVILRKSNPAAMVAMALFPFLLPIWVRDPLVIPLGLAIAAIVLIRHRRDFPDLVKALAKKTPE